eukprot:Nk52_evm82s158 gene=Nk52_evmTU82s158
MLHIEALLDGAPGWVVSAMASVAAIGTGWIVYKLLKGKASKSREGRMEKPGIAVLHQFPRGWTMPSYSPACLKTETFMRMAGVPYENKFGLEMSSKGKLPFIRYEGAQVDDSNFIVTFLSKKFDINLYEGQSPEDAATGHAICRMIEEHFYFLFIYERWVKNSASVSEHMLQRVPSWIRPLILRRLCNNVLNKCESHGVGLHDDEERMELMLQDIRAVSAVLGKKKFLLPGNHPTVADCTVFGTLANVIYDEIPTLIGKRVREDEEFSNLREYAERMKERYWGDWDQQIRRKSSGKKNN